MLSDKSYHDYDYTDVPPKRTIDPEKRKIWSAEKIARTFSRLRDPATGKPIFQTPDSESETAERIQRDMRKDKGLTTI